MGHEHWWLHCETQALEYLIFAGETIGQDSLGDARTEESQRKSSPGQASIDEHCEDRRCEIIIRCVRVAAKFRLRSIPEADMVFVCRPRQKRTSRYMFRSTCSEQS